MKLGETWQTAANILVGAAIVFCVIVVLHVFTECVSRL